MVLEIKPPAEDIEPEVSRPGLFISEPTRQLRHENLLAQFLQDFADVLLRVTLRDQVDRRFPSQVTQRESVAGWIGAVQPVQKGLPWLHHDGRSIQHDSPVILRSHAAPTAVRCRPAVCGLPRHRRLAPARGQRLSPFAHLRQPYESWWSIRRATCRWLAVRFF